jgi:hypothetical protein
MYGEWVVRFFGQQYLRCVVVMWLLVVMRRHEAVRQREEGKRKKHGVRHAAA